MQSRGLAAPGSSCNRRPCSLHRASRPTCVTLYVLKCAHGMRSWLQECTFQPMFTSQRLVEHGRALRDAQMGSMPYAYPDSPESRKYEVRSHGDAWPSRSRGHSTLQHEAHPAQQSVQFVQPPCQAWRAAQVLWCQAQQAGTHHNRADLNAICC